MQDVLPLPGDTYSYALAINDAGDVTGLSIDSSFTILRAFVVVDGVPRDLNKLIPDSSPLQLQAACSINSRGDCRFGGGEKHRPDSRLPGDPGWPARVSGVKSRLRNQD